MHLVSEAYRFLDYLGSSKECVINALNGEGFYNYSMVQKFEAIWKKSDDMKL